MPDTLGKIVASIMMTFSLFITVMSLLTGVDRIMDAYITNKATSFVDVCRTTGKIDPVNYQMFCDSIYKIGDYDIEMCHGKRVALSGNGQSELTHKEFYDEQILAKMYEASETEDYPYLMNNGDYLKITIRKENSGLAGGFYEFFLDSTTTSSLLVNYSGIVGSNGTALN